MFSVNATRKCLVMYLLSPNYVYSEPSVKCSVSDRAAQSPFVVARAF